MYATRSGEFAPLTITRRRELAKLATRHGYFGDTRHGATVKVRCPLSQLADWLPRHYVEAEVNQYDAEAKTAVKALRRAVLDHLDPDNRALGDESPDAHMCPGLHAPKV
jgi:hypothetical protein